MTNVLYCFDRNCWRLAAVSIFSLLEKNSANVHCMVTPDFTNFFIRRKIRRICRRFDANLSFKVVRNKENPYSNFQYGRWSPAIFLRLLSHKFFPGVQKMLYLDADTLIMQNLDELFNTDMNGYAVAGIRESGCPKQPKDVNGRHHKEFKKAYLTDDFYMNSGVLLIDVPALAAAEKFALSVEIKLVYPDQDLLNYVFDGRKKQLPLKYNFVPYVPAAVTRLSSQEVREAEENPAICHFYALKPQYVIETEKFCREFLRIANILGWDRNTFLRETLHRKHRKVLGIPWLSVVKNQVRIFGIRFF